MSDYIPKGAPHFMTWLQQLLKAITPDPTHFGLVAADVATLQAQYDTCIKSYNAHLDGQKHAVELTEAKDKDLGLAEAGSRSVVQKVNAHPHVDNAMRALLGVPAHAETRSSAGKPTTWPIAHIVDLHGHRQETRWVDKDTPLSRKRPEGVQACEIFLKIGGDPPIDETTCKRVARDTATPYVFEFETADIGKTAYWLLRWVNGKDEPGPFGPLVSATITA
jgi:hypothetical protein